MQVSLKDFRLSPVERGLLPAVAARAATSLSIMAMKSPSNEMLTFGAAGSDCAGNCSRLLKVSSLHVFSPALDSIGLTESLEGTCSPPVG